MEDREIIDLYWRREETAISETDRKYGALCRAIARNVLDSREDAEECVNDAYHRAWTSMPPQRPDHLGAWLGRVVRNLALNRWSRDHSQKRGGGMTLLLSELEDCIPNGSTVEGELENARLGEVLSAWLGGLPREDRVLFLRRYWYGQPLNRLAEEWGMSPGKLAQRMYRLRLRLKAYLEQEEICL